MKKLNIIYWISTGLISLSLIMATFQYAKGSPEVAAGLKFLGYPPYLTQILGTAKALAGIILLLPLFPRLKEWAYAGVTITMIGAAWSHIAVGDTKGGLSPVIVLAILAISYVTFRLKTKESQPALKTA